MHRPSFLGPAALLLLVAGSPSQPDAKGQSRPAVRQLALLLQSPIDSYLEPCGCGGQNAGGLARRAALIGELRGQHRDPIVIAVGRFGIDADALPVIVRTLAALGTDAIGLGAEDLIIYDTLRSLADSAGLSLCSLTPPLSAAPPPARGVAVRRGDCLVGVLSVAFGQLGVGELTALAAEELARMRTNGCAFFVLLSHLGETTTARLLEGLPPELRPRLVALATNDDLPVEPIERLDATWVPLAQKGRSLAVVTATPAGDGWRFEVEQHLVTDGPRDPAVQGWVDEFYQRQRRA
ncbi:MAG: hypothetical protein HUU35_10370, partial [Armatimonadetes bacterium]|nr:hypothetical protein [Armatimonadota bacterium]